jgi:phosphate uptake regulator
MEKRVFKFGKTSFAIILPKKWIDKSNLKLDEPLFVSENERGDLVISLSERSKKEFEIKIDSKFNPILIGRWVGKLYLYGLNKIKILSENHFTEEQIKEIEDEIKNECSGFEITHQTNNEIYIEDFTDLKEISIDKIISRLKYLIKQQFEEAKKNDVRTVRKIEFLVDRFERIGKRYLNIVEPKDTLKYFTVLSYLEDISDDIFLIVNNFKVDSKTFEELSKAFDICFDGLEGNFENIQKNSEIRKKIYITMKKSKDKLLAHLIEKISDRITQISEFGLKKEESTIKKNEWTKIKN